MLKLPDWKNQSEYPKPGRASNSRFAWEFLRRNADYGRAWSEYIARMSECAKGDAEAQRVIRALDSSVEELRALWDEFDAAGKSRDISGRLDDLDPWVEIPEVPDGAAARQAHAMPLARYLAEPFGLESMKNPAREWGSADIRFLSSRCLTMPTSYGLQRLENELGRGKPIRTPASDVRDSRWLIVQIDLTYPKEVIEARLRRLIRSERKGRIDRGKIVPIEARAQSPDKLVTYLRVLDAQASGVAFRQIGEVLFPRQSNIAPEYGRDKRVKAACTRACYLRDGGYKILPALREQGRQVASWRE